MTFFLVITDANGVGYGVSPPEAMGEAFMKSDPNKLTEALIYEYEADDPAAASVDPMGWALFSEEAVVKDETLLQVSTVHDTFIVSVKEKPVNA